MPVLKISRRSITGLDPGVYYDSELKGFGLRIGAGGTGTWFAEYRPGAGGRGVAKERVSIGSDRVSPEQAREAAGKLLAGVELGADPAAAVAAERAALPFQKAAEAYIKEHVRAKRKSSTADLYDGFLRRHIAPHLGSKKSGAVTGIRRPATPLSILSPCGAGGIGELGRRSAVVRPGGHDRRLRPINDVHHRLLASSWRLPGDAPDRWPCRRRSPSQDGALSHAGRSTADDPCHSVSG